MIVNLSELLQEVRDLNQELERRHQQGIYYISNKESQRIEEIKQILEEAH